MNKTLMLISIFFLCAKSTYAQFGPQRVIANNTFGAESVYGADLDGDGDLDALSASFFSDKVVWYKNIDGLGNFSNQIYIAFGDIAYGATKVIAHDFDSDGDIDVAYGTGHGRSVVWYENTDGNGNFELKQIISDDSGYIHDLFASDLDKDGDLDILSVSSIKDELRWYENTDGSGSFVLRKIFPGKANSAIYAADLDNDGFDDVVASYGDFENYRLSWYRNLSGLGDFSEEQVLGNHYASDISVGDVDADGNLDIVFTAFAENSVGWYKNMGNGNFQLQIATENVIGPQSLTLFDFDNDGDKDIVVALGIDSKIICYENIDGSGSFQEVQAIYENLNIPYEIRSFDFDSDGYLDIIYAEETFDYVAWHKNSDFLGTSENEVQKQVNIFPNPAINDVIIHSETEIADLKIYDASGKLLANIKNKNNFNVATYPSGTYFVEITDVKGTRFKNTLIKK